MPRLAPAKRVLGLALSSLVTACIASEPIRVEPTPRRPTIVRALLDPPASEPLLVWPRQLNVFVELSDAKDGFFYLLTASGVRGPTPVTASESPEGAETNEQGRRAVRRIVLEIADAGIEPDPTLCAVLTVRVARTRDVPRADPLESDSVEWFYIPPGATACPRIPGGPFPSIDAGEPTEAGAGS
jgi:hypothetical protein